MAAGVQERSTQGWPPESALDAGDASEDNASGLYDTPGQRWYECDKCGFLFPETETAIHPDNGLRLCLTGPTDYDTPDIRKNHKIGLTFYPEEKR